MSVKNRSLGLLALLFGLAACGGSPMPAPGPGPGPGPGPSPTVSRIVLAQDDVLLENVGVSERLSARLLDAQGREVTGAVTWQVEKGAVASVAADGTVTGRSVGSTIVRATANGLTSAPIVVAVADLKDSVTRVPNERVVSPPVFASGAAPFQLGSRYTVVMRDVSPTAGRLWFSKAADGTPIQGQVVSSRPVANGVEVTLEVVPLGDVFDKLVVNESFELSSEDVTIPEATAAHFGVQRQSNGDLVLTPNKAPSGDKVGALAFNAGPFRCTGSDIEGKILLGSPSFRFNFGRPKVEVEVVIDSNFIDGQNTSKARFLFTANPSLRMSSGNHTLVADLNNVEVKCKLREGFEQAVPTGIPLVNLEANLIPGIELGGSYGAGRRSFEARLYASANVRFGFDCRASTGSCQNLSTGVNGTVQGNVILGETGTLGENIRDLKIGVFGDVKITGTAPLVGDIDLGSMREGYLMEYDLAPLANQIADNNPAGYTLRHYQVIDPFTSMRNLVSFLLGSGVTLPLPTIDREIRAIESPVITSATRTGNTVRVSLDPDRNSFFSTVIPNLELLPAFPLLYNVKEVRLLSVRELNIGGRTTQSVTQLASMNVPLGATGVNVNVPADAPTLGRLYVTVVPVVMDTLPLGGRFVP